MNIRKMPLEKLELLSYADIAYELLKLDKKSNTTPTLFGEVCELLKLPENHMMEMIGDFYTTLTTDQRFILLESAEWDLKDKHAVKAIIDDDEDEEEEEDESSEEETDEAEETEDDAVKLSDENYDDDDEDDDLSDLAILTEEELEE